MNTYIGTKIVNATPMNRLDYNTLRGWTVPADENPADDGYLVEYTDGGKPNVEGYAGYVSWSPKEQFDNAYLQTDGLPFGLAIEALRKGERVARSGWNGKGMWLSLTCPETREVPADGFWSPHNKQHAIEQGGSAKVLPSITMKTATGEILIGWLASQSDIFATDWMILT